MNHPHSVSIGTAGGTLLSIVPVITSTDVVKTIILAAIGAAVSCLVSMLIRCLFKKQKK
ncbi:hypothetical protein [Flavobacterium lacus]|uniref:hypothetical protein n=1 Tax=Flavobacterium lacus TaxID=1353778 RepID=UPI0015EC9366|nr:hypothetical protein [Flavobacterium lacus]